MTDEMIIGFLKQVKEILLYDKSWLESTKKPISESFDRAIKSIEENAKLKEAVGKIKEEIKDMSFEYQLVKRTECVGYAVWKEEAIPLDNALEIIDKHTEGMI